MDPVAPTLSAKTAYARRKKANQKRKKREAKEFEKSSPLQNDVDISRSALLDKMHSKKNGMRSQRSGGKAYKNAKKMADDLNISKGNDGNESLVQRLGVGGVDEETSRKLIAMVQSNPAKFRSMLGDDAAMEKLMPLARQLLAPKDLGGDIAPPPTEEDDGDISPPPPFET